MLDRREFLAAAFAASIVPHFEVLGSTVPEVPLKLLAGVKDYDYDIRRQCWWRVQFFTDEMGREWMQTYSVSNEMLEDQGINMRAFECKDRWDRLDALIEEFKAIEPVVYASDPHPENHPC